MAGFFVLALTKTKMSQLIELIWRNTAYEEAIKDPSANRDDRKGAMFAGFKTEMAFDAMTSRTIKKVRQEHYAYDRMTVYPGMVRDSTYDYNIGPQKGVDPWPRQAQPR